MHYGPASCRIAGSRRIQGTPARARGRPIGLVMMNRHIKQLIYLITMEGGREDLETSQDEADEKQRRVSGVKNEQINVEQNFSEMFRIRLHLCIQVNESDKRRTELPCLSLVGGTVCMGL